MYKQDTYQKELETILSSQKKEIARFSRNLVVFNNKANQVIATFIQQAQSCGVPPEDTVTTPENIELIHYHRKFSLHFNTTQILVGKGEILLLPPPNYLTEPEISLFINNHKHSIKFNRNEVSIKETNSADNSKKTLLTLDEIQKLLFECAQSADIN